MIIFAIYIACYKYDFYLTKICVASVRYWYPDIPIYLLKDLSKGDFDTSDLEKHWKVKVHDTQNRKFGWGFIKFEAWFQQTKKKILVIDSDICFVGKVLDKLNSVSEDFIVSGAHVAENDPFVFNNYFDLSRLKSFDPQYEYPGYVFNTGQLVVTTNLIKREQIKVFLKDSSTPTLLQPDTFKCGEQGLANYIICNQNDKGNITVSSTKFYHWIFDKEVDNINLDKIKSKFGYPMLIHWAGTQVPLDQMPRKDILHFYNDYYFSKIPKGEAKKSREQKVQPILHFLIQKRNLVNRAWNKLLRITKLRS